MRLYKSVVKGSDATGWQWQAFERETGGVYPTRWVELAQGNHANQAEAVMAAARALMFAGSKPSGPTNGGGDGPAS